MPGPRMFVSGTGFSSRPGAPIDLEALRKNVDDHVKAGVDCIKVYGSVGGFDNVNTTQTLSFDQMKTIVDAAHAQKKKVAIHSYGPSGVKDAVRAGADSIEHGIDLDDDTLAEMSRRGIVWVPTIDHNQYYIDAKDEYGFKPEAIGPLQEYIKKNFESAKRAVKAGVKLAVTSDGHSVDGLRRRLHHVRPQHARARVVRQGWPHARTGARHRDNDGRGAVGHAGQARARRARLPRRSRRRRGRSAERHQRRRLRRPLGDEGRHRRRRQAREITAPDCRTVVLRAFRPAKVWTVAVRALRPGEARRDHGPPIAHPIA